MKKTIAFIVLATISINLFGQNPAKKYTLLEHFTNSKCSVCASKNPAFYTTILSAANKPNIHHLSIHPPKPYTDCVFYQANKTENQALADFYSIPGTPRVFLNGTVTTGSTLITQAKLDAAAAETSPVIVLVSENTNASGSVDVKVTIKTVDAAGAGGSYLLYAAVAEKVINQTTPNGEAVHHDVFRKMLTPVEGTLVTLPAVGQSVEHAFNFPVAAGWKASEVFVTAYLRDPSTKAILQSGTRFDPVVLDAPQPVENQSVSLFPNPVSDELNIASGGIIIEEIDVFNPAGKRLSIETSGLGTDRATLQTGGLEPGFYFTKVRTRNGASFGKFLKN